MVCFVKLTCGCIIAAQTPALQWQTTTTHDFKGGHGRPSTTERYKHGHALNLTLYKATCCILFLVTYISHLTHLMLCLR